MAATLLKWQTLSALFLTASAVVNIKPSNSSSASDYEGRFQLEAPNMSPPSPLVPLTSKAANGSSQPIQSTLFVTDSSTINNLSAQNIAYLSCDASDYPGNLDAEGILQHAFGVGASAYILYSRTSQYCVYDNESDYSKDFMLYSMTRANDSSILLDNVEKTPASQMYFATIRHITSDNAAANNGSSDGQNSQNNPLGPSPSTAVAMIILYSITGIITALFLVIIITGAVRAHRHPDRYGPRDVLGRPRQSRARGLGRAILDTIPIVKFGEREPPKPSDVELGSTAETRTANEANMEEAGHHDGQEGPDSRQTDQPEAQHQRTVDHNGIAPAEPLAPGAAVAPGSASTDEGLGCSICTDDFERGQDIRVLPCNHKFHPECVDPWLLNVSGTCPLCRIDLRPVTSHDSSVSEVDHDHLAPPLEPQAETSNRRRSALRDILSLRSRPEASTEERIAALRRLREQRENGVNASGDLSAAGSSEDVSAARRSRRISTRLHDVFSVRTRRNGAENAAGGNATGSNGESSNSASGAEDHSESEERRT